jgi:ferrochelatase
MKLRNMPELRTVRHFHDDQAYIDALAQGASALATTWPGEKLLMSFHGVPRFTWTKGDPTTANV